MKDLEKIARAINPVAWLVESHLPQREESLRAARRAVEVMRGQTEIQYDAITRTGKIWKELDSSTVWRVQVEAILDQE